MCLFLQAYFKSVGARARQYMRGGQRKRKIKGSTRRRRRRKKQKKKNIGGQDYPNLRDIFAMICMVWTMQTNGKPNLPKSIPLCDVNISHPNQFSRIQTNSLNSQTGMQTNSLKKKKKKKKRERQRLRETRLLHLFLHRHLAIDQLLTPQCVCACAHARACVRACVADRRSTLLFTSCIHINVTTPSFRLLSL